MKITDTERELLEVATTIGAVAESNCHFTTGLAGRIDETRKHLAEMTISEFLAIVEEYTTFFNKMWSGGCYD